MNKKSLEMPGNLLEMYTIFLEISRNIYKLLETNEDFLKNVLNA
jgi:hypothetical protein